jgi:hypothetical protein
MYIGNGNVMVSGGKISDNKAKNGDNVYNVNGNYASSISESSKE